MAKKKSRFGRRTVLKGAAGVVVALPFLSSIDERPAAAQLRPDGPQRLFMMSHVQGWAMADVMPDAGYALRAPMADLEPVKNKCLMFAGIDNRVSGGGHNPTQRSQFSCMPSYGSTEFTDNIFSSGPSVDQLIANRIANGGPIRRLDLADRQGSRTELSPLDSPFFWHGDADPVTHLTDPHAAFAAVFGDDPGGEPEPEIDRLLLRRRSVLDTVLGQFNTLSSRVSTDDRRRLEQHADKIRQIEQSLGDMPPIRDLVSCEDRPSLPDISDPAAVVDQVSDALIDIAVLGTACGVADVTTLVLFEGAYDWLNDALVDAGMASSENRYHLLWHRYSDNGDDGDPRTASNTVNRWHISRFARYVNGLDAIDEGDGTTALDHTLAVMVPEFGNGGGHASNNLPAILAGNLADVPLGRYIDNGVDIDSSYPSGNSQTTNQLHVSILNAFGDTTETFGDYSEGSIPTGGLVGL